VGLSLIIFLKLPASSHLQIPLTQGHQEARSSLLKIWAKNSREVLCPTTKKFFAQF
jgi:hypothetical protein